MVGIPGGFPLGVAITPDGKHAYFTEEEPPNVVLIIDTHTNRVVNTVNASGFGIAFAPDGQRAYVAGGTLGVAVIDTASEKVVATVPGTGFRHRGRRGPAGQARIRYGRRFRYRKCLCNRHSHKQACGHGPGRRSHRWCWHRSAAFRGRLLMPSWRATLTPSQAGNSFGRYQALRRWFPRGDFLLK
jgi:YVTN family beta-propeller protein